MNMHHAPAPLDLLVDLIQVEPVGTDRFRGQSEDIGTPAVFGGQVLGQALMAASVTVPPGRMAHSLHAYFLLPGQHAPIDYEVERVRDGGSFATRRVVARQQGVAIFELTASFHSEEAGPDRHDPMPPVPGPEGIRSEMEHRSAIADQLPPALRGKAILQAHDRVVGPDRPRCLDRILFGRAGTRVEDVLQHRPGEQVIHLQHKPHLLVQ